MVHYLCIINTYLKFDPKRSIFDLLLRFLSKPKNHLHINGLYFTVLTKPQKHQNKVIFHVVHKNEPVFGQKWPPKMVIFDENRPFLTKKQRSFFDHKSGTHRPEWWSKNDPFLTKNRPQKPSFFWGLDKMPYGHIGNYEKRPPGLDGVTS